MKTIQVFEYGKILVGTPYDGIVFDQNHYNILSNHLGIKDESSFPYYSLIKEKSVDGIKFKQYVGTIQVGDLIIEILPKADKGNDNQDWKSFLLYMLSKVFRLKINSESTSSQKLRSSTILDFIFLRFLDAAEELTHQGLIKTYRYKSENTKALKGKILFTKQVSQNIIHKERFFVNHTVYDYSHIMNRILYMALNCIVETSDNTAIRQRANQYLASLPELEPIAINDTFFTRLKYDRKTDRYRTAISLAELILLNNMPNLSSGKREMFAMLFDMNRLWEEFIYVTLKQNLPSNYYVKDQVNKRFWERKHITADIIIKDNYNPNTTFVLDTKWKRPEAMSPSDGDLHQMYVYYKYYEATKVALLYPTTSGMHTVFGGTFADGSDTSCDLIFLPMPQQNESGKEWQRKIATSIENWFNNITV